MSVWETLSKIDLSDKVEKKGNLTYVSWAWAWEQVMNNYPSATYEFEPPVFFQDGSCEVWVTVTIEDVSRKMWLPVMDNRNNSIENPNSRKIGDARMRCLTKCLAMFGLGHYIYAGEDLPAGAPKFKMDSNAESWIAAINSGNNKLEEIEDPEYREFIKENLS